MIENLNIENFMLFEKLEIPTLKRVNLIGGRNNSGKTALVESIRILISKNIGAINEVLKNRQLLIEGFTDSYDGLFNRKQLNNHRNDVLVISINELEILRHGLGGGEYDLIIKLQDRNRTGMETVKLNFASTYSKSRQKAVFLPFYYNFSLLNELWENIVLTPIENSILDIIRETIEPKLSRIDVGKEIVRVKLEGEINPVPLGTLGDGVQRILLIALSLANAKNSYLLIDEIELGLHHSVLEKLWKMIFKYAKKWNIQVFVTTHSQDALRTFSYIASEEENKGEAQFIRLQIGRTGKNEAILFDTERLNTTLDLALEIR